MATAVLSPEETVRRGREIYESRLKSALSPNENGKFLVINVATGEYEVDADHLSASHRAAARFPGAPLYAMRIGYPAGGRIGRRSAGVKG